MKSQNLTRPDSSPIGVFDSGFGGLTVQRVLLNELPEYDYLYLGDSARTPYGTRSADVVLQYTVEAVEWLFRAGCPLVVLACNTATSMALRTIQMQLLPSRWPDRRVLGVVRPSVEELAELEIGALPGITPPSNAAGTVGVLGTPGTIRSNMYQEELSLLAPSIRLVQQACPMWVPLVESGELEGPGTDFFIHRYLDPLFVGTGAPKPTKLLLGCTHYPLLLPGIKRAVPSYVSVLTQGSIVARRLKDWLDRHSNMEKRLSKSSTVRFVTTDNADWFSLNGSAFLGKNFQAEKVRLT
ncbi:MAG TPA: glutamate racemase [Oligoflexales bacterium]|nr:glutamate racemase [Oligoflexales bacterium]